MAENKAEIPRINSKTVFKKPNFFKSGVLVFKNKEHPLTLSNGYYRCTLNCNGKCDDHNKQIKSETLERAFSRYVSDFQIDKKDSERILTKIFRENLMDVLLGIDNDFALEERLFETTVDAAKKDFEDKVKIKNTDIKTSIEALAKMSEAEYPLILLAFILGILKALSYPEKEAELARNFSFIVKKIYLSDDGKIISIELERWGWYILNTIGKNIPNYLSKIRNFEIPVVNGADEILDLKISKAALQFGLGNVSEAMGTEMKMTFSLMNFMKNAVQIVMGTQDIQATNMAMLGLLDMIKIDPAMAMLMRTFNAIDLKINQLDDIDTKNQQDR